MIPVLANKRKLIVKPSGREADEKQMDLQGRTSKETHNLERNLQKWGFKVGSKIWRLVQNLIEEFWDPLISRM